MCCKVEYVVLRRSSQLDATIEADFSRADELKLRQYLKQLLEDRSTVLQTVVKLESINLESSVDDCQSHELSEAQRLDLENAVLMQELMAIKVRNLKKFDIINVFVFVLLPPISFQ